VIEAQQVRGFMDVEKQMQKAQRILDQTIETLKGNTECEVFAYDEKGYKGRFFTKGNKSSRGVRVNIPEEWIEDTSPSDNNIRDELRSLLRNLEQRGKKKRK
jgi:hypothetical protein